MPEKRPTEDRPRRICGAFDSLLHQNGILELEAVRLKLQDATPPVFDLLGKTRNQNESVKCPVVYSISDDLSSLADRICAV